MAYSPSQTKVKQTILAQIFSLRHLSLRSIKRIVVLILAGTILALLVLWRPMYLQLRSLQMERNYWQKVLQIGAVNFQEAPKVSTIPTLDQLPDLIDQCRGAFAREGVAVSSLNVERFGARREVGNRENLDYGLVRLKLQGQWQDIVKALEAVEEMREFSIHVQEVLLGSEGGEVLLQIYFCTVVEP